MDLSGLFRIFPPQLIGYVAAAIAIAQFVVMIVLALAVARDARVRRDSGGSTFLIGSWLWGLVVLFTGGYVGALGYWVIHYSSLRYRREEKA